MDDDGWWDAGAEAVLRAAEAAAAARRAGGEAVHGVPHAPPSLCPPLQPPAVPHAPGASASQSSAPCVFGTGVFAAGGADGGSETKSIVPTLRQQQPAWGAGVAGGVAGGSGAPRTQALASGVFGGGPPAVGRTPDSARPAPAYGGPPATGPGCHAAFVPAPPPLAPACPLLAAAFAVSPAAGCVDVSTSFHPALRAALDSVPGATWVPDSRVWRIPLARVADAESALRSAGVRLQVEPLPPVPLRLLQAAAALPDDSHLYDALPPRLESALMPFQREGVRFVLRHGGRALVGDEMGLGKTVQAIAFMAAYRAEWPCLIVAPSSLREAWADALGEWLGVRSDRVVVIHSGKDGACVGVPAPTYDFVITSYGLVGKLGDRLAAARFRVVVLDESHYIKEARTQRAKDVTPIAQRAARCVLLSGTPALAKPKDLLSQLAVLLPGARLRMKEFGERYCAGAARPGRPWGAYDGASNLEELNRVLTAAVMVRRLKADVLTQLPPKTRQQVFLELDAKAKADLARLARGMDMVRAAYARASATGGELGGLSGDERRAVMDAYHQTALLKAAAVQKYVEELLDEGNKFLIFAHHKELLDAICFTLNRRGVKHMRIDGSVASSKRQGLVDGFQTEADCRAAVLSISAAGVGLTLTGASVVVFAELSWTPGQVVQAEDRAHRIGQSRAVNVYYLHVRGSVDDVIWSSLQRKLEHVGQAINGKEDALTVVAARQTAAPDQPTLRALLAGTGSQARRVHGPVSSPPPGHRPAEGGDDDACPVSSPPPQACPVSSPPLPFGQASLDAFFGAARRGGGAENVAPPDSKRPRTHPG